MPTWRVPPRPPSFKKCFKRLKVGFGQRRKITSSFSDLTRTSLVALSQSADAFPPLKSICGGVLSIWDTAERVKSSRTNAKALALRCHEILNVVADSVVDPSALSPEMNGSLAKFNELLDDIEATLDLIQNQDWGKRLLHLNRHQDQLQKFRYRLDEAHQDLITSSSLRTQCVVEATYKHAAAEFQSIHAILRLIVRAGHGKIQLTVNDMAFRKLACGS
ncbi:hypothetical protein DXG01_013991 [Tephrocybe rancida]|nr:hypothetical protein DXG01_013991 [Tephrocybe rancida]